MSIYINQIPSSVINAPIGISIDRERAWIIVKKEQYHRLEIEAGEALGFAFEENAYICKIRSTAKEALFDFLKLTFYDFINTQEPSIADTRAKMYEVIKGLYEREWDKIWSLIKPRLSQKINKIIPNRPDLLNAPLYECFMKHQREGVLLGIMRPDNLISFQQGLGKSVTALGISLALEFNLTVIVCPSVCKINWYDELIEWGCNKDEISVVDAKPKNCKSAKREKYLIINYDILYKDKFLHILINKRPQHIIFDECHYIKTIDSRRFKASFKIITETKCKITLLSGTPIKNRLDDMFSYLNITRKALGRSKVSFEDRFLVVNKGKFGKQIKGAKNFEVLSLLISNFMIRKTKEQCLDLPKKVTSNYYFSLDEYKDEYEYQLQEFINAKGNNKDMVLQRLMIITTKAKVKGIINLIESIIANDEKVVLFCSFLEPLAMFKAHFGNKCVTIKGGMDSQQKKDAENIFKQNDEVMVLLGQTTAAGIGINLVNAHNVIPANFPFTYAELEQALDRTHRIGQQNQVNVYYPICEKSVDEQIFKLIMQKYDDASKVVDKKEAEMDFNNVTTEILHNLFGENSKLQISPIEEL